LPAAQDEVAFFDQERGEPGQEQLPDVSMAVDGSSSATSTRLAKSSCS